VGTILFFSFFFGLVMCRNHKHEALWLLKICMLYILCTLILFNFLHSTIGSSLILIHNELWTPKCCHAHSKVLFLMFRVSKKCHQNFNLLLTYCSCHTSFFWVKSGEKWLICSVFSPKSTPTLQKFPNTPMYTIRGYLDTLVVWLSLVPFATSGTYGHDHGWKQF